MTKLSLYIHTPVAVFKARVNMAAATYPATQLIFDTVTLGAYTDIFPDMTLLLGTTEGADDLGRIRVKTVATSSVIPIPRTSEGIEDGQLDIQDNAYITVLDDYRPWAKIPYFDLDNGIDFKDGNIPVGDYNVDIPPVSNCGPGFAGVIDPDTGLLTVEFPKGGINLSFAVADGATIDTYAWNLNGGTATVGTVSDDVLTATFPAGFYWVALTVVDSNGRPHTSKCPVLAIDPDDDPRVQSYQISQRLEASGQTLDIELFSALERSDYPDGTLVMFWWDEAASPDDRDHMKFIGWLDSESYTMGRIRTGVRRSTRLRAVDLANRLKQLPGFPQALYREEEVDDEGDTISPWSWMPSLDIAKQLYYLLFWHSTALELGDFILPDDLVDYDTMRLDSGAASLFDQVDTQAQKIVPDHYLTCNSQGQLIVQRDWMLDDVGDRPAAAPIITEANWNDMQIEYSRHPEVHVLRSGAIAVSTDWVEVDGEDTLPLVFSVAPSNAEAFGQGVSEHAENEGLALDQAGLNTAEGHRYALLNSRYGAFNFTDPTASNFWEYEPALFARVQLNIGAIYAAQRGLPFTQALGRIKSVGVNYAANREGISIRAQVSFQKEESGAPAITYIPEDTEDVGYTPPPPSIPGYEDPELWHDDMKMYLIWDSTKIGRTDDISVASPTWELVTGDVTGTIRDIQQFMVDEDTVGAWCLTSNGMFVCQDLMADPPVWDHVLSVSDVMAAQVNPLSGNIQFVNFTLAWLHPGHCCITCSPVENQTNGDSYEHAYFAVTEDYGVTWEHVNLYDQGYVFVNDNFGRSYSLSGPFSIDCNKATSRIWCLRVTARWDLVAESSFFASNDLGYTWFPVDAVDPQAWTPSQNRGGVLAPFPLDSDHGYWSRATGSSANRQFYRTDAGNEFGASNDALVHPTGYSSVRHQHRPNKHTNDPDHVMIILSENAGGGNTALFESYDAGDTWDNLLTLTSDYIQPNGWPADTDQWVIIRANNSNWTDKVRITYDNFGNLASRNGNLETIFSSSWSTSGHPGGFALPRVGVNA